MDLVLLKKTQIIKQIKEVQYTKSLILAIFIIFYNERQDKHQY